MKLLVVLVALLAAAPARAGDDLAGTDTDTIATATARDHFDKGTRHFNLGEFDAALDDFRAAYSLTQSPVLLFNMGQACRAARRYSLAIYYYQTYLKLVPDAPERAYIARRVREMEEGTAAAPPPSQSPTRAVVEAPAARERDDAGRAKRTIGLASAGAGVALLATAVFFAAAAQDAADDVSRAYQLGQAYGPELEARYADGRRDELVAIVGVTTGAALVVGGGVLWYLGWRETHDTRVAVAPGTHGATMVMSWSF